MKNFHSLLILMFLTVALIFSGCAQRAAQKQTYTHPESGITINVPGSWIIADSNNNKEIYEKELNAAARFKQTFLFGFFDSPERNAALYAVAIPNTDESIEKIYDNLVTKWREPAKDSGITVIEPYQILMDSGIPTIVTTIDEIGRVVSIYIFKKGTTLYQITVISTNQDYDDAVMFFRGAIANLQIKESS